MVSMKDALVDSKMKQSLVQPEASSPPFAPRSQANLPPISCTRFNNLLVRLIRGKSCPCQQHRGQDFPRGVLASPIQNVCAASVSLFLALQPVLAEAAPAQDAAVRPPAAVREAPAQTAGLVPHRAVYELTLAGTGAGSNVTDIHGQLVYDFHGSACQGYTLNTRLITEVSDREGKVSVNDIRTESWEDAEGKRLRFSTAQFENGRQTESTKGTAHHVPNRPGTVVAHLDKPKRGSVAFSGNIVFPTQHSIRLLKTARAGESRLQADIYDGSEKGIKIYETSTVIGPPLELSANSELPAVKNSDALNGMPSWPVVVSYYEQNNKKDGFPTYEISFRMYANGVSRKLRLDYGTFSLDGELSGIEFFEAKPCP